MWKKEFDTSYVGFMKDGAQWLVDNTDIKLVGKLVPFRGSLVALQKMFLFNLEYLWPFCQY
jgi:hypothetical protein